MCLMNFILKCHCSLEVTKYEYRLFSGLTTDTWFLVADSWGLLSGSHQCLVVIESVSRDCC